MGKTGGRILRLAQNRRSPRENPALTRISAAGFYAQNEALTSATRRSRRRGGQSRTDQRRRTSHLAVLVRTRTERLLRRCAQLSLVFWDCTQFGTSMRPTARKLGSSLRPNETRSVALRRLYYNMMLLREWHGGDIPQKGMQEQNVLGPRGTNDAKFLDTEISCAALAWQRIPGFEPVYFTEGGIDSKSAFGDKLVTTSK